MSDTEEDVFDECTDDSGDDDGLDHAYAAQQTVSQAPQVWDRPHVQQHMESQIAATSQLLNLPRGVSVHLLRHTKWITPVLQERFFEDTDRLCREACVLLGGVTVEPPAAGTADCSICCIPQSDQKFAGLPCGHKFCLPCWRQYLEAKVAAGPDDSMGTRCPEVGCAARVPRELFVGDTAVVSAAHSERYLAFELEAYVTDSSKLRWCPGRGCSRCLYVEDAAPSASGEPIGVRCTCGEDFCFFCGAESHAPSSCEVFLLWRRKEVSEDENGSWMAANTKPCPGCGSMIEKNGGCNRITCRKCGLGFCWMCGGTEHYACNRYNRTKELARFRAKEEHEMYKFYYDRYRTHADSKAFAVRALQAAKKNAKELAKVLDSYLEDAATELTASRHVLKHTYPYAYFLRVKEEEQEGGLKKRRVEADTADFWQKGTGDVMAVATGHNDERFADQVEFKVARKHRGTVQGLREIFELNQAYLEENVEKLSEMLEAKPGKFDRQRIVDQTGLVRTSREQLREGIY
eukprot:TRINITY_DN9132_c0_g1_i1.p1 TRINITY_DN9132_c0_g1~~TRINITY_DN9132_c0_g1_i1.p1  ORF type:complete len:518 (+),score=132.35 TRINITY_DN9132_c0_g1_i1:69-1622(+)